MSREMERMRCIDLRLLSTLLLCISLLIFSGPVAAGAGAGAVNSSSTSGINKMVEEEEVVVVEFPMNFEIHRRILATLNTKTVLSPDRAGCIGSCPARGGPYTGRGCSPYYHCRS